jgi:hypothetical protein
VRLRTNCRLKDVYDMIPAAGGSSPVRVVADLDTDVLAIPAQALVETMARSRVVARDISAVTEARLQVILAMNRGLRVVA